MARHPANVRGARSAARLTAMIAALLLTGLLVTAASRAVFSDSTTNTDNAFSAGTVVLTDDDGGSVLFNVSDMAPGASHENCLEVTYSGSLAAEVRLYGAVGASSALNDAITVTVERGTGGAFAGTEPADGATSCTGFSGTQVFSGSLTVFLAATDYASGHDSWAVTNGSVATYRFLVEFDTSDDSLQGGSSEVDFIWEAQST